MNNQEIEKIARLFLARPQFPNLAREVISGDDRRGAAVLSEVLREVVSQVAGEAYVEAYQMQKCCLDYYGEKFPEHLRRFQDERLSDIRALDSLKPEQVP